MTFDPTGVQIVGTALFAIAVAHTFLTKYFERIADAQPAHAGVWHLLAEVEAVFGFWALIFVVFLAFHSGTVPATTYLDGLSFTEPMFVFVVMVIAASRPILRLAQQMLVLVSRSLPAAPGVAFYFVVLTLTPLLGSFITEPAAMTLAALLLRDQVFRQGISERLKYATLAILFVNVSIGGTLTPYAAPPVLMVAAKWGWDLPFMLTQIGWKAAIAVLVNSAAVAFLFRRELARVHVKALSQRMDVPISLVLVHLGFLVATVVFAHHPPVFMGLFLFFLGVAGAYERHQDKLMLREGLMVAFFLAGLVVLGGQQSWWLQPTLAGLDANVLYFGATALTAITDNAALTYLGSLVDGTTPAFKYALVTGAVTGGGLTVIANAPNPAGWAILAGEFEDGAIAPLRLFIYAVPPTLMAVVAFTLL
jgi:hypothetical protein